MGMLNEMLKQDIAKEGNSMILGNGEKFSL